MPVVKARIAADNEEVAGVMSVTVFGHELTRDYAEIEVSDSVLTKLNGNLTIEVLVRKPATATSTTGSAPAPAAIPPATLAAPAADAPNAQPQG